MTTRPCSRSWRSLARRGWLSLALALPGGAAAALTAAEAALIVVERPGELGYWLSADADCGLDDARAAALVEETLLERGIEPLRDVYSPEGLQLDVTLTCLAGEPGEDAPTRIYSVDAAFSLLGDDDVWVSLSNAYGWLGAGDPDALIEAVRALIESAADDYVAANADTAPEEPPAEGEAFEIRAPAPFPLTRGRLPRA